MRSLSDLCLNNGTPASPHLGAHSLLIAPIDEQAVNGRLPALGVREALGSALGTFGGCVGGSEFFAAILARIGEIHVCLGLEPIQETAFVKDVAWALAASGERREASEASASVTSFVSERPRHERV